ncbi:MAG: sigma-70 family RNA polymerase sigma factor [Myxococcales bacterium]|nr:sigma-70 family RNA polymerase sigma factor [Myxococcales bacterium]
MEELARWLERAKEGEEAAYRELYRRFRPPVVRLASAFASLDRDEVEDVVQESFARAFRALPKLRQAAAFEPWLYCIARNRARTLVTRKSATAKVREELAQEPGEAPGHLPAFVQRELDAEEVRRLIAELPQGSERRTVELFYLEGELSAREIASQLGVGKSAVTMRLERFRARIKKELLRRLLASRWE